MAFGRNKNALDVIHDGEPKKIVILTGPTFGTVAGFLLLGAAMGAAATLYLKGRRNTPGSVEAAAAEASLYEGLIGADAGESAVASRTNNLAQRVKKLSARARDTIQSASEALAPAIQEAISEAKSVASKTEHELEEELQIAKEEAKKEAAEQSAKEVTD